MLVLLGVDPGPVLGHVLLGVDADVAVLGAVDVPLPVLLGDGDDGIGIGSDDRLDRLDGRLGQPQEPALDARRLVAEGDQAPQVGEAGLQAHAVQLELLAVLVVEDGRVEVQGDGEEQDPDGAGRRAGVAGDRLQCRLLRVRVTEGIGHPVDVDQELLGGHQVTDGGGGQAGLGALEAGQPGRAALLRLTQLGPELHHLVPLRQSLGRLLRGRLPDRRWLRLRARVVLGVCAQLDEVAVGVPDVDGPARGGVVGGQLFGGQPVEGGPCRGRCTRHLVEDRDGIPSELGQGGFVLRPVVGSALGPRHALTVERHLLQVIGQPGHGDGVLLAQLTAGHELLGLVGQLEQRQVLRDGGLADSDRVGDLPLGQSLRRQILEATGLVQRRQVGTVEVLDKHLPVAVLVAGALLDDHLDRLQAGDLGGGQAAVAGDQEQPVRLGRLGGQEGQHDPHLPDRRHQAVEVAEILTGVVGGRVDLVDGPDLDGARRGHGRSSSRCRSTIRPRY